VADFAARVAKLASESQSPTNVEIQNTSACSQINSQHSVTVRTMNPESSKTSQYNDSADVSESVSESSMKIDKFDSLETGISVK
jgi:hypothetical protein